MNCKNQFFMIGLVLIVFLTVSCVCAADNQTLSDGSNQNQAFQNETDVENEFDAKLIAHDYSAGYGSSGEFSVMLVDENGTGISGENVSVVWSDGKENQLKEKINTGEYKTSIARNAGNYKATVVLKDSTHAAKPVSVNVKITKANVKLNAKAYFTIQNKYAELKVTVKDSKGALVNQGNVKFKINGKTYKVNVKKGVAVKKVKLSKARTYSYKATFTSANYNTKSATSKIHVYSSSKSARTFSVKGYKIVVPMSKFKKMVEAKNTKTPCFFELKTNKVIKQSYRHYYKSGKYVYKTVNARAMISFEYGGYQGLQNAPANKYSLFLFTRYQAPDSFCTPHIGGLKVSSDIAKLEKAKTRW